MPDDRKKDLVDVLAETLGRGWKAYCDPNMWRRWRLSWNSYDFCCARRKGDLLRTFIKRVRDSVMWNPVWRAWTFPVPEFLRCGSVEELKLKLETARADT